MQYRLRSNSPGNIKPADKVQQYIIRKTKMFHSSGKLKLMYAQKKKEADENGAKRAQEIIECVRNL